MNNWAIQKAEIARKQLLQAGFTLIRHADSIRCTPTPPEDLVALIRAHKPALLEILAGAGADPTNIDRRHRAGGAGGDTTASHTTPPAVVWVQYECCDGETRAMLKADFDEIDATIGLWDLLFGKSARKLGGRVRPFALAPNQTPERWGE